MGGILALPGAVALGGGGPQNVLVVVNDNAPGSLELGQYYQEKRGLPEANLFHIATATNYSIDIASYSNQIEGPVKSYIASSGLSNQIDYIVFSRDIPYRVYENDYSSNRHAGLTASMFYGFKSSPDAYVDGCVSPPFSSTNRYFEGETAFTHSGSPGSNQYYLSSMLTAWTLQGAKTLVDRSVEADRTSPTGAVYLIHTSDRDRRLRWSQFEDVDFLSQFLDIPQYRSIEFRDSLPGKTNVIGCTTGWGSVTDVYNNVFVKGAIGDHFTSNGGYLLDPVGQMSILDWIGAGCVGSYGTVVEPCNSTNKFPQTRLHYWYGRGFSMGESYWMAVRNPYQGVVVGDPLCAPYAVSPAVAVGGIASSQVVTGTVSVTVTGVASSVSRPVDQLDLFLDGVYLATLTNISPRTSNVAQVTVSSTNCTYVAPAGASLFTVVTGLTAAINQSNLGVTARSWGDRIELRQKGLGTNGAWITCTATGLAGSASEAAVWARTPYTNFLETTYRAHEMLALTATGAVQNGDVVRLVVSNLAGGVFTNEVAAAGTNNTAMLMISNLYDAVNNDTNLQDSSGCEAAWGNDYGNTWKEMYLLARTNTWEGYNLRVLSFTVSGGLYTTNGASRFNGNTNVMTARATVFLSEGRTNLAGAYSLNTAALADGPHELMAVAYEGTAVKSQGRVTVPFVVNNHTASCAITSPADRASFLLGTSVTVHVNASAAGGGSVSTVQCYVEGKLLASMGTAPYVFTFSATNYGVGLVGVQARSISSNGDAVLSERRDLVILPDYDFDGLDDAWEIGHFGGITNWGAWDDPDTDGVYNVNEYIADTQPTSTASKFSALVYWRTNGAGYAEVDFGSSTARQYWIHYLENPLDATPAWLIGSNALTGTGGTSVWYDNGADLPAPTGSYRFYRVRVLRP